MASRTERLLADNVRRYPWYLFFRDCNFWGPAFFLYFSSILPLQQVLWLEAIYYVTTALVEVPSGYMADRYGRRQTLVFSSLSLGAAYLLFFIGHSFLPLAIAQLLLAAGFAGASGTDTALHFESLRGLDRTGEYAALEARALRRSFLAGAFGALFGGVLATYELRSIYAASCLCALLCLYQVLRMSEPRPRSRSQAVPMGRRLRAVLHKSFQTRFRFFTVYVAVMTVAVHLPYEFYQPYLERVGGSIGGELGATPALAGLHLAVTMFIGSWGTGLAAVKRSRRSVRTTLLSCLLFQVLLVGGMALVVHPLVVCLLTARTVSKAIAVPLLNAEVAPQLKRAERSTYLSLQSLFGRLSFGLVLLFLPVGSAMFPDRLYGTLLTALIIVSLLFTTVCLTPFPGKEEGRSGG